MTDPIPWTEVETDIQEAIYTFAVLTKAGIPGDDIKIGWAYVVTDSWHYRVQRYSGDALTSGPRRKACAP